MARALDADRMRAPKMASVFRGARIEAPIESAISRMEFSALLSTLRSLAHPTFAEEAEPL